MSFRPLSAARTQLQVWFFSLYLIGVDRAAMAGKGKKSPAKKTAAKSFAKKVAAKALAKKAAPKAPAKEKTLVPAAAASAAAAATPMHESPAKSGKPPASPGPKTSPGSKRKNVKLEAPDVDDRACSDLAVVAPLVEHTGTDKLCNVCTDIIVDNDFVTLRPAGSKPGVYRCGGCNRTSSRVQRFLAAHNDMRDGWAGMSKEQRNQFIAENHKTVGDNLKALVTQTTEHKFMDKMLNAFGAKGKFMDEEDVRTAFVNKPDQLANILMNARRHTCRTRKVVLYEVPDYESVSLGSRESCKDRTVTVATQDQRKGQKRIQSDPAEDKPPKKAKALKQDPPLNEKNKFKLAKLVEALDETLAAADAQRAHQGYSVVPGKVKNPFELLNAELLAAKQEVVLALDHGYGNVAKLVAASKAPQESLQTLTNQVAVLIASLWEEPGEDEEPDEE